MSAFDKIARIEKITDELKSKLSEKNADLEIISKISSSTTREVAEEEVNDKINLVMEQYIKLLQSIIK